MTPKLQTFPPKTDYNSSSRTVAPNGGPMVPQTLTPESFNPVEEQGALSGYHGGAIATDETVTAPTGYEIVCVRGLDDTSAISAQTGNFDFAAEVIGKTGDYVGRWSSVTVVARVAYWLIRKYN